MAGPQRRQFPEVEYIDTNSVTLEVFQQGEGRPVVLCHGWPELAYSWRHQIAPLASAGYHVIAPNQRGYGRSTQPPNVTDYDVASLCGDLVGLLDHYGYDNAIFAGHDWGAIVVWNLAMLHPERVAGVINLSVPFMERGDTPWVEFWEQHLGGDFYIVHFNRHPGVADGAFAASTRQFLGNLYRTRQWEDPPRDPEPGMPMINLANRSDPAGEALMSDAELDVFVESFTHSGFTGGINWYRNFDRNWHHLENVEQLVKQPSLMIYGNYDMVPKSAKLSEFVPDVEVASLECGHWIQQEEPAATTALMCDWLSRHYPA
jgi:pimeloyl-ACP methyl ester carboxylesterase